MPSPKKSSDKKLPAFEGAMEELEELVEELDSSEIPLNELLTRFERGASLLKHCRSLLDDATQRIELIELDSPSSTKNKNTLDQSESLDNDSRDSDQKQTDDDIELF